MPHSSATADYALFVGVDIAAATVTASWLAPGGTPSRSVTVEQTPHGHAALQRRLLAGGHEPDAMLVVMEATGSYWLTLATTLAQADFRVAVINPAQAHHFAKALLKRAKADAIDAQTLAHLAALLRPAPWTPPPAVYDELQQRLVQRDALLGMRQQAANHLHALSQRPVVVSAVRQRLEALIQTLDDQIAAVEDELAAAAERVLTIPGGGLITTAYAGLAPRPYQSGTSVRGRPCIGQAGHGRLRQARSLATLSACRYNPVLRAYYQRLRAAGKPMKVARCAAARKLLHIAWAVATKGQPFDPTHSPRLAMANAPAQVAVSVV